MLPGCIGIVLIAVFGLLWIEALYLGQPRQPNSITCRSNMKQIGLALQQYAQDNDAQAPPVGAIGKQTWREASYPYTKSVYLYQCPDDARDRVQYNAGNLPRSYAVNVTGWGKAANEDNVVTLVDTRGYDGPEWDMASAAFAPPSNRRLYTHKPPHYFFERPAGKLNCLFGDGHVKSLFPEQTMTPTNLWTRDNAPFTGQGLGTARAILKRAE